MASRPIVYVVRALYVFIAFVLVAAFVLPMFSEVKTPRRTPSCVNNLRQMGLSLKMYSNEAPGERFPPLSIEPGKLMCSSMYPEYLPDPRVLICPDADNFLDLVKSVEDRSHDSGLDPEGLVDDWSYFYVPNLMLDDEDMETFAEFYKGRAVAGQPLRLDIELPETKRFPPDMPRGGYNVLYHHRIRIAAMYIEFGASIPGKKARELEAQANSYIPVMIERPGNHDTPGGHVLYLDGHVEFIRYPGKWPMTEKTIALLNELDALGAN